MNIPNYLTIFRISLVPIFVVVYFLPFGFGSLISSIIFTIACFTDWLDGYLARKLKQESRFGEFLDPVADKFIVICALMLLIQDYGSILLTAPAIVIVSREVFISALREWMAEIGKRGNVSVTFLGKLKTFIQMIAIICLLLKPDYMRGYLYLLGVILIYVAAGITVWSMYIYLKKTKDYMFNSESISS